MIKVMIVDDHELFSEGLSRVLDHSSDIEVVVVASNGAEALQLLQENEIDVVVLDIEMPGRSGIDVLKDIRKVWPAVKVLILSMHSVEQYAVRAIRAGASGYLSKEKSPFELTSAIRKISEGGMYIDSQVAAELALVVGQKQTDSPHSQLSDREMEVMLMLARGRTVKEVAEDLSLSANTVSTYRARILSKMMLRNNAEIAYYAAKEGLIE